MAIRVYLSRRDIFLLVLLTLSERGYFDTLIKRVIFLFLADNRIDIQRRM